MFAFKIKLFQRIEQRFNSNHNDHNNLLSSVHNKCSQHLLLSCSQMDVYFYAHNTIWSTWITWIVRKCSSNLLAKFLSSCVLVCSVGVAYIGSLLGTCSQMLRIKNKATQKKMLNVKVLRPLKHYFP